MGWFRLDPMVMALATVGLVAMMNGRRYVWPVVAGFGFKLWPIVLVAVMILRRQFKDAAIAIGACLLMIALWAWYSPEGFRLFLDYRKGDGFQIESFAGALVLMAGGPIPTLQFGAVVVDDNGLEWVQVLLNVLTLAIPAVLCVGALIRRGKMNAVAFCGALTTGLILSTRILSPQYLLWIAPMVVLLWPQRRALGIAYCAASWASVLVIAFYTQYALGNRLLGVVLIGRNLLLVYVLIEFCRCAWAGIVDEQSDADDTVPVLSR